MNDTVRRWSRFTRGAPDRLRLVMHLLNRKPRDGSPCLSKLYEASRQQDLENAFIYLLTVVLHP